MRRHRMAATMVLIACVVVSGCGGSRPEPSIPSAPAEQPAKPATSLGKLLPTAADFPAGTTVTPIDLSAGGEIWELAKSSTYAPPECGEKVIASGDAQKQMLKGQSITAISRDPTMSYSVILSDLQLDLAPMRALVDTCPNVHQEYKKPPIKTDTRYERVDPPADLPPSDSFVYRGDSSSDAEGLSSAVVALAGVAVLRGVTVTVLVQGLGGAKPDRAAFDKLLVTAARNVVNAA